MKPNQTNKKSSGGSSALLIIDMLNTFDFPQGRTLAKKSEAIAKKIYRLKTRFKKKKLPVIYVNDNFGKWQSDWIQVYESCTEEHCLGKKTGEILRPDHDDYFVLKPRHSGFYCTNLEILLSDLNIKKLVLTGISGNICVLFTAHDAHMLNYKIVVPSDCIASNTAQANKFTLSQVKEVLNASTVRSEALKV